MYVNSSAACIIFISFSGICMNLCLWVCRLSLSLMLKPSKTIEIHKGKTFDLNNWNPSKLGCMYDLNFKPPNNLQNCHDFFQHQNMAFGHFSLPFFTASLFYHHQVSMPIARRLTPWHPRPTTQNLVLNTSVSDFLSIILTPPRKWRKYIYIYILYWEMIRKKYGLGNNWRSEWWETSRCWAQGQKPCTEHTSGILRSWNRKLPSFRCAFWDQDHVEVNNWKSEHVLEHSGSNFI